MPKDAKIVNDHPSVPTSAPVLKESKEVEVVGPAGRIVIERRELQRYVNQGYKIAPPPSVEE